MKQTFRAFLVILLFGWVTATCAQSIAARNIRFVQDVETLFSQGVNEYRLENYQKAVDIFLNLIRKYPDNQRITAIELMLGRSYYQLKKYNSAISTLRELIATYPQSNYADDSHFFIGLSFYKMDNFVSSVRELLWITDYGKDKRLVEKSRNLAIKILENNLSLDEIANLRAESVGEMSSMLLTIKLAQRWNSQGNKSKATQLLKNYIRAHSENDYISVMREVLKQIENQKVSLNLKVGVILPLSSEYAEQAQSVLAGIKYALKKFNSDSEYNVDLVIKDSEGSIISCVHSVSDLVRDDNIVAIIGELESENTASIAPIINYNAIPLIVPVASANGLAELSKFLFQVNGNLESRGELLAKYAMNVNHDSTFATMAPADQYGKDMTDSFTAAIDKLGGEIFAQKWYYGDAEDMGRQFKSIREIGFSMMNRDSLIDHYTRDMTPYQKSKFRISTIPVTTIDAVFFPIYTDDIKYVVPQFAFANVRAQIYGGQYWYDLDELRNKNIVSHVDSLTFVSDYYLDEIDPEFRNFRADFRKEIGTTPGLMDYYGYDAMSIILDAIKNDATTREAIKNHLNNLDNFMGIRGPINFKNNQRVNTGQRIIMFVNGRFILAK
ncbi:ABC transporter substrate-binding protein [candidate division KSB1 bacterium]|nr:ABC transporter substrate-binding protein [candidate division KSB1 bacterium]